MKLIDIQHNYDAVFSLGNQCFVSRKLHYYNLRLYAGVIDWMISYSLTDVVRLLQNGFVNFMEKETMVCDGYNPEVKELLLLRDTIYNIISVHDFLSKENTPTDWNTYPAFKIKLNRRIERFLSKLETSKNILFVRIGGTYEEAKLLETALSKMVKGNFQVLLLNPISEYEIIEYDWELEYTCSIGIPMDGNENPAIWDQILKGITHSIDI